MDENNDDIILENDVENESDETSLKDKLKKLRGDLQACQKEKVDYLAGWQRAKADFINARRDEEKVRMEFIKYSTEKVLKEILPVLDSLEMALKQKANLPPEAFTSFQQIHGQLLSILKINGVAPIESVEEKFDPIYHEAIGQMETDSEEKDGIVLEEAQKGYMIHDRVLRPAKVKVGVYSTLSPPYQGGE